MAKVRASSRLRGEKALRLMKTIEAMVHPAPLVPPRSVVLPARACYAGYVLPTNQANPWSNLIVSIVTTKSKQPDPFLSPAAVNYFGLEALLHCDVPEAALDGCS